MHKSSLEKMERFRDRYLLPREQEPLAIFDLGSMDVNGSYRPLFDRPSWMYTGLDMAPGDNVDVVLKNPYDWREIGTHSADVVISGQAFEHIEFFWITMLEVARVLKPGGLCCIIAPSGGPEHRYPVDCWRFYKDGFAAMARFARIKVLDIVVHEPATDYDDMSNLWADTMFVGQAYKLHKFFEFRQRLWRWVMHRVLTRRLPAAPSAS